MCNQTQQQQFSDRFNKLMSEIEEQAVEELWREEDDIYFLKDGSVLVVSANYAGEPGTFGYDTRKAFEQLYEPDVIKRVEHIKQ